MTSLWYMNPSEAKVPRPFRSNWPGISANAPITKTAAVTETWNTAAARSNRRRARGLASRALDSSGERGFILLAQSLSRLTGGFVADPGPLGFLFSGLSVITWLTPGANEKQTGPPPVGCGFGHGCKRPLILRPARWKVILRKIIRRR